MHASYVPKFCTKSLQSQDWLFKTQHSSLEGHPVYCISLSHFYLWLTH